MNKSFALAKIRCVIDCLLSAFGGLVTAPVTTSFLTIVFATIESSMIASFRVESVTMTSFIIASVIIASVIIASVIISKGNNSSSLFRLECWKSLSLQNKRKLVEFLGRGGSDLSSTL